MEQAVQSLFHEILIFFILNYFFIFLNRFNILILKINLKNKLF
jgi:hypothetical protein